MVEGPKGKVAQEIEYKKYKAVNGVQFPYVMVIGGLEIEMKEIKIFSPATVANVSCGFDLIRNNKNDDYNENKYIYTKIGRDKFSRKKKEDKYYQLIDAPNKNILLETSKKLKDPNASGWTSSRDNTLSASFVMKTQYYVLNKDKVYVKTKLSSGSVAKALNSIVNDVDVGLG